MLNLLLGLSVWPPASASVAELIATHYPTHYVAHELQPGELITLDGRLDDPAWEGVPWLDNFLDLAGPRYAGKGNFTWQEASRSYAQRFTGSENPTRVKVRWDDSYLYIGAELRSRSVAATVTGHCGDLASSVWTGTPVLPYFDDDFEVFINAAQDNYYYVEFETNARNATYSTLWSLPQAGLGSVAPECGGGGGARDVCCDTQWNGGKGLCDHGVEVERGAWTMEMYEAAERPGAGMLAATHNGTDLWSLEVRFPLLSRPGAHGGLINADDPARHYPGTDPFALDPNRGRRYWWATFANALHAPWWHRLDASATKRHGYIQGLCNGTIEHDEAAYGFSQFLVDANNAAPTCYYEAASQHLGGHQYMCPGPRNPIARPASRASRCTSKLPPPPPDAPACRYPSAGTTLTSTATSSSRRAAGPWVGRALRRRAAGAVTSSGSAASPSPSSTRRRSST